MTATLAFNGALVVLLAVIVHRARQRKAGRLRALLASEDAASPRGRVEALRRQLQIRRGILRQGNGLGVVVTPRPARAVTSLRAMRRRARRGA